MQILSNFPKKIEHERKRRMNGLSSESKWVHARFFSEVSVAQSLVFCVAWCGPLSVHSSFYVVTIVLLSELRLMITSFGIFNIS
jgi:hypothetical protein